VYSGGLRFTANESLLTIFAFPLFPSLFLASIRELSKHRDSGNLHSTASRVVGWYVLGVAKE
jgi:hypothetical protein